MSSFQERNLNNGSRLISVCSIPLCFGYWNSPSSYPPNKHYCKEKLLIDGSECGTFLLEFDSSLMFKVCDISQEATMLFESEGDLIYNGEDFITHLKSRNYLIRDLDEIS